MRQLIFLTLILFIGLYVIKHYEAFIWLTWPAIGFLSLIYIFIAARMWQWGIMSASHDFIKKQIKSNKPEEENGKSTKKK